jgi:hypothetical protein
MPIVNQLNPPFAFCFRLCFIQASGLIACSLKTSPFLDFREGSFLFFDFVPLDSLISSINGWDSEFILLSAVRFLMMFQSALNFCCQGEFTMCLSFQWLELLGLIFILFVAKRLELIKIKSKRKIYLLWIYKIYDYHLNLESIFGHLAFEHCSSF